MCFMNASCVASARYVHINFLPYTDFVSHDFTSVQAHMENQDTISDSMIIYTNHMYWPYAEN